MTDRLLGVVLCGGRSSRMGQDKSTLAHPDGGTFLQHAITRLTTLCDQVALSGHTDDDHRVTVIEDPIVHRGPAAGIATSLQYGQANQFAACLITPVDTPFLTADDLRKLSLRWQKSNITTLAFSKRLEPLIGIYPVDLAEQLQQLADSDDRSLFRWFRSHPHQTVQLADASCRNINHPEDLAHGR